jgi:hypothetical protein
MVDLDVVAEWFWWAARILPKAGHYRFRTERVYLPRRPVQMKKSSTNERVKWRRWNLRRYCAPPDHTVKAMCAAQYFSSNRQRVDHASTVFTIGADEKNWSCRRLEHNVSSRSPST